MEGYVEKENATLKEYGIEFFMDRRGEDRVAALRHSHPALEFLLVQRGTLRVTVDNQVFSVGEGEMLSLPSHTIHSLSHVGKEDCLYFVLKIHPSLLFDYFVGEEQLKFVLPFLFKRQDTVYLYPKSKLEGEISGIWQKMIREWQQGRKDKYLAQRFLAGELLLALVRSLPPVAWETENSVVCRNTVELVDRATAFINENYAGEITAGDCADAIHVSYSYLAKLFHAVLGKTFKEYLTAVRMAKAKNILLRTDISVTDTAMACGYSNPSYFIAEYHRTYGETPTATKKRR